MYTFVSSFDAVICFRNAEPSLGFYWLGARCAVGFFGLGFGQIPSAAIASILPINPSRLTVAFSEFCFRLSKTISTNRHTNFICLFRD